MLTYCFSKRGGIMFRFECAILFIAGSVACLGGEITYTTVDVPGSVSSLVGGVDTSIYGISNNGVAVGVYEDSSGNEQAFERLANGTLVYPVTDPNGSITSQGQTFFFTVLSGINNSGTAIGVGGLVNEDPFFWNSGTFTSYLPITPPADINGYQPYGINDLGQVSGTYGLDLGGLEQGFIGQGGATPTLFTIPGSFETGAGGINDLGDVVGEYLLLSGSTLTGYGYIRQPDGTFITVTYPGAGNTDLVGINDAGAVVGWYGPSGGGITGYFYGTPGDLVPFAIPGAEFTDVTGINDAGQLVGSYGDSAGVHGFIASVSDVPEPSSGAATVIGLGLLALKRSRIRRTRAELLVR